MFILALKHFNLTQYCAVGHVLTGVNGNSVTNSLLEDGTDVMKMLADPANYPISLRFARPRLTTNEKIFQVCCLEQNVFLVSAFLIVTLFIIILQKTL